MDKSEKIEMLETILQKLENAHPDEFGWPCMHEEYPYRCKAWESKQFDFYDRRCTYYEGYRKSLGNYKYTIWDDGRLELEEITEGIAHTASLFGVGQGTDYDIDTRDKDYRKYGKRIRKLVQKVKAHYLTEKKERDEKLKKEYRKIKDAQLKKFKRDLG